jgi:uncharacterized RDD family membrane protein YckC
LLLTIWWLYFVGSWTRGGQTVGMRAWRLVLRSEDAPGIGWARASLRFFAAGLSTAALGLGFLWCLVDPRGRTWHDRLSRTSLSARPGSTQPSDGQHRDRE